MGVIPKLRVSIAVEMFGEIYTLLNALNIPASHLKELLVTLIIDKQIEMLGKLNKTKLKLITQKADSDL